MPDVENNINQNGIPEISMEITPSPEVEINMAVSPSQNVMTPTDPTLSIAEMAADAKATGDAFANVGADIADLDGEVQEISETVEALSDVKIDAPATAGTQGQLLMSDGEGGTSWTDAGTPSDAQVEAAVADWLDDHPEATTTVEDGAISRAKLNDDLKAKTDAVPELESAVTDLTAAIWDVNGALAAAGLVIYNGQFYINPDGNSLSA